MKAKFLFVAFVLFIFQMGFAQEVKPIATDSTSVLPIAISNQKMLEKNA